MEEARREKRKNPDSTPRKRKKKKGLDEQEKLQALQAVQAQSQLLGPFDHQNLDKPPNLESLPPGLLSPDQVKKKRIRKKKKELALEKGTAEGGGGSGGENVDIIMETFNQQLKQLPLVPLMEPDVGHTYTICSLAGSAQDVNCKLSSSYIQKLILFSFYYFTPFSVLLQSLPLLTNHP